MGAGSFDALFRFLCRTAFWGHSFAASRAHLANLHRFDQLVQARKIDNERLVYPQWRAAAGAALMAGYAPGSADAVAEREEARHFFDELAALVLNKDKAKARHTNRLLSVYLGSTAYLKNLDVECRSSVDGADAGERPQKCIRYVAIDEHGAYKALWRAPDRAEVETQSSSSGSEMDVNFYDSDDNNNMPYSPV